MRTTDTLLAELLRKMVIFQSWSKNGMLLGVDQKNKDYVLKREGVQESFSLEASKKSLKKPVIVLKRPTFSAKSDKKGHRNIS